jgi:hypothetical protein
MKIIFAELKKVKPAEIPMERTVRYEQNAAKTNANVLVWLKMTSGKIARWIATLMDLPMRLALSALQQIIQVQTVSRAPLPEVPSVKIIFCICFSGYSVDENYKCKPQIGSPCVEQSEDQTSQHVVVRRATAADNILCATRATCSDQKCAIVLDQPCFGHESSCKAGLL